MKIVLLPLDERPCNYLYPKELPLQKNVNIVTPTKDILSLKKDVCNIDKISDWLKKECFDADFAVISLDTLLFGGIIPSRLHHQSYEELCEKIKILEEIKNANKNIKIYCNELIMRCPSYSLSDEEPFYFDECGKEIFELGGIIDKEEQGIIEINSPRKMELLNIIKKEYLDDFLSRRDINIKILLHNLDYVNKGIIDFFVIPQDDCSEFGFPSKDQRLVKAKIKNDNLFNNVIMYPGADEIGLTLITRAINIYNNYRPKVFVNYCSELGKNAIPMFEDRPISETIKYHLLSTNCLEVYSLMEADCVLNINSGSEFVPKWDTRKELIFGKNRNLLAFIDFIKYALNNNKIVGIADVCYCNEADKELMNLLKDDNLLLKIHSYAGWNTSSNTLGTTIANMISYYYSKDEINKNYSLIYRYLDDYIYMGIVRDIINNKIVDLNNGITRFNLKSDTKEFEKISKDLIIKEANKFGINVDKYFKKFDVSFIWNRTFEIEFDTERI